MIYSRKRLVPMKRRKNNNTYTAAIISIAAFAAIVFTAIGIINWQQGNNARILSQVTEQKQQLQTAIKQDTYSYINEYMHNMELEGATSTGSIGSGNTLTQAEINELVANVSAIVENTMTDEVMTGASQLAVDELNSQIDELVAASVKGASQDDINTMTQEVKRVVLTDVNTTLTTQKNLIEENAQVTSSNTQANAKQSTQITNLENSIASVQRLIASIEGASTANKTSTDNKINGLSKDVDNLESDTEKLKKELENEIAATKKVLEAEISAVEAEGNITNSSYSYDKNTNTLTITIETVN